MESCGPCIAWLSHLLSDHPLWQASDRASSSIPGASVWTVKLADPAISDIKARAAPAIS